MERVKVQRSTPWLCLWENESVAFPVIPFQHPVLPRLDEAV